MSATELGERVRLSDPRPAYCSACFNAPNDVPFVDMQAAFDGGQFRSEDGTQFISGSDDLHLCSDCVRAAAQALDLKPDLHARQLREIRRLEIAVEHWRSVASRNADALKQALETGPEHAPVRRGLGRPRKDA